MRDSHSKIFEASKWDVPLAIQELVKFFLSQGVSPWLVGGIVRDHFLTQEWGSDWDFELHTENSLKDEKWEDYFRSLVDKLSLFLKQSSVITSFESEELNFKVFRFILYNGPQSYDVELSGPRQEIYPPREDKVYGHCDFDVRFDSSLSPKESFKRRDFTVNAMAFAFLRENDTLKFELVDPYQGEDDLKKRILRPCDDEQFYSDPVRALRAIRFQHKLGFNLRDVDFERFRLEKLSTHYVLEEGKKSRTARFFQEFFQVVNSSRLEIPAPVKKLSALVYLENPYRDGFASIVDLISNCEKTGLPFERMEKLGRVLGIKKKTIKSLIELKKCAPASKHFDLSKLRGKWENQTLDEILKDPFFNHLKKMASGIRVYCEHIDRYPELESLFPLSAARELAFLVKQEGNTDLTEKNQVVEMLDRNGLDKSWYQFVDWYLKICSEAK